MPQSDPSHERGQIWKINDQALQAFILEHISRIDLDFMCRLGTAHEVYKKLHKRHKQIRLHAQVLLIKEALNVCFQHDTALIVTTNRVKQLWEWIVKMGSFDNDKLLTILLINGLSENFPQLQSVINGLLNQVNFSSNKVMEQLEDEDSLQNQCMEDGIGSTALAATTQIVEQAWGAMVYCVLL
ncbi:hypothetical protein EDB92DRAFT_1947856 [Lactarius akahatsu]|uniref:Uncharacterized protein n=1 Tax=Lactarius akahatsu TaxID=416441 RepID=A0AAD4LEW1_9AGAM|nr:hypothetical protein EDB92DRAFT_1947856 [Lactarius akahatsu]